MEKELYTVQEVADKLRTSPEVVRQYTRSKRIKSVKLGRKIMIKANELERILDGGF